MKSLLGHIVLKSTYQAENLATESLYYILSNSTTIIIIKPILSRITELYHEI